MYCCFKRALRILEHSVARSGDHNALTIFGGGVQVGDLVVQKMWEADGVGIVIEVCDDFAAVLWPGGEVNMLFNDLEVISASR